MNLSKCMSAVAKLARGLTILLPLLGAGKGLAQQIGDSSTSNKEKNELAVGYRYITANNSGGGIRLNGAYLSEMKPLHGWLGLVVEVSQSQASNIDGTGDNFKLQTLSIGPRSTVFRGPLEVYGQALLGVAHANETYAPTSKSFNTNANTYAASIGMGANLRLNRWLSARLLQIQYLRTGFANEGSESQQHFTIDSGLVVRFGPYKPKTEVVAAGPEFNEIFFSCGTENLRVEPGQTIEVLGHAYTEPDPIALQYSWKTSGGVITGSGRDIHLNTTGLHAGEYKILGRAALVSSPSTSRECEVTFRVLPGGDFQLGNDAMR